MYQLEYPWLLALLPLPLLVWWLLPPYREESAAVRLPFFGEVARAAGLTPEAGAVVPKTNWLQKILAPVCWALVVLALARPQYIEPPIEKVQPARDLLLALDLSQSMDTRDFRAPDGTLITRVDAVRKVVDGFVERRKTDRIGLIVFGDAPYPQAPFTLDHRVVHDMIAAIEPGMAGPRTALGDALGLGIRMFEESHAPEKVLIVLTDGNDTASKMPPARAADIASQNHVRVHTVGIGSTAATGEDRLDLDTLKKIAAATGGQFFFGQDQQQLTDIYRMLDRLTPANNKTLSWRPKRELFHVPLGASLALLLAYQVLMYAYTLLHRMTAARAPRNAEAAP